MSQTRAPLNETDLARFCDIIRNKSGLEFPPSRRSDVEAVVLRTLQRTKSPTVAAFLSLVFSVVNGEPPETTLGIPPDFVRTVMQSLGLGTREVGLEAIVARLKRHARDAASDPRTA